MAMVMHVKLGLLTHKIVMENNFNFHGELYVKNICILSIYLLKVSNTILLNEHMIKSNIDALSKWFSLSSNIPRGIVSADFS